MVASWAYAINKCIRQVCGNQIRFGRSDLTQVKNSFLPLVPKKSKPSYAEPSRPLQGAWIPRSQRDPMATCNRRSRPSWGSTESPSFRQHRACHHRDDWTRGDHEIHRKFIFETTVDSVILDNGRWANKKWEANSEGIPGSSTNTRMGHDLALKNGMVDTKRWLNVPGIFAYFCMISILFEFNSSIHLGLPGNPSIH